MFAQRGIYDAGGALASTSLNITPAGSLILRGVSLGTFELVRALYPTTADGSSYPLNPLNMSFHGAYKIFAWMPDSLLRKLIDVGYSRLNQYFSDDIPDESEDMDTAEEFERYWRTLTLNCERYSVHRLSTFELAKLRLLFDTSVSETQAHIENFRLCDELNRLLCRVFQKWTFAVSSTGVFCMVSLDARVGDCIVIVEGARIPLILCPI